MALPPLAGTRWLTSWTLDLPVLLGICLVMVGYLLAVRRLPEWPRARTVWFGVGLVAVALVKSSFLASYDHQLFWALAVQDVVLLALVPVALVLGHPIDLVRAAVGRPSSREATVIVPVLGSLAAMMTLLAVYLTGWDQARLEHRWLFTATHLLLVLVGAGFVGPLLSEHGAGYGGRTLVALFDGLLDAIPGLAVLGNHASIAAAWYAAHPRAWGPTPARDQLIGGTAMIALGELVGLPTLIVLLVRWARADSAGALIVDAHLDRVEVTSAADAPGATAEQTGPPVSAPWWETDAGPLADRAAREGWQRH